MKTDILIIGGGASGLMAAYSAATTLVEAGSDASVTVLEKMPRPGRKIMITGKGRCNFTNLKDWNDFSGHVRSKPNALRPAFYNFTPEAAISFFESCGMKTVVERGDRAFPASYRASDVVDALVRACQGKGVKVETETEVATIERECPRHEPESPVFKVTAADGRCWISSCVLMATGGLSYPGTGSTGDGYRWASESGHRIVPLFPALTALVPRSYKDASAGADRHIDRSTPLSEVGARLCGISLKNIGARLLVDGTPAGDGFGDIDFTDGGVEGPLGFQLSRKAVKAMINGAKVALELDLKPGVPVEELSERIRTLWDEVQKDPRSTRLSMKERFRILLGKLMPWELIPAFMDLHPELLDVRRDARRKVVAGVRIGALAPLMKSWRFDIAGYVGYERAVVTAGGVSTDDVLPKTLESRIVPGLYFCGEVLDLDADTGGYNLQIAFCTGALAGRSAALALIR